MFTQSQINQFTKEVKEVGGSCLLLFQKDNEPPFVLTIGEQGEINKLLNDGINENEVLDNAVFSVIVKELERQREARELKAIIKNYSDVNK